MPSASCPRSPSVPAPSERSSRSALRPARWSASPKPAPTNNRSAPFSGALAFAVNTHRRSCLPQTAAITARFRPPRTPTTHPKPVCRPRAATRDPSQPRTSPSYRHPRADPDRRK
jgi:hypothetical protein